MVYEREARKGKQEQEERMMVYEREARKGKQEQEKMMGVREREGKQARIALDQGKDQELVIVLGNWRGESWEMKTRMKGGWAKKG
jgi:hypothetical protein